MGRHDKRSRPVFDRFMPWGEEEARAGAQKVIAMGAKGTPGATGQRYPCKVCIHPDRLELDVKILSGAKSLAEIAKLVAPTYSYHQVTRHRDAHLLPILGQIYTPSITNADLMAPLPFGASIQRKMEWYRVNFLLMRQRYMKRNENGEIEHDPTDTNTIIKLLVEARNTDVIATKFAEGDGAKPVNPEPEWWPRMQKRLEAALEAFPDAREAVVRALEEAE